MTTHTTTPRVYVACLAAYNNGRLHGRWIDAAQPPEDIWSEVQAMLAGSPEPFAEEWAIHDYEGFGELRLGESESFERVAAVAVGVAEQGDAFTAWLAYDCCRDASDTQAFEDAYRGRWDSLRDYAENFADDIGLYDIADKADSPYVVVDIQMLERDLDIELYTVDASDGGIYVFDLNP